MRKPRIIIADEDSNYIVPLQYKIVTEYFDRVDLCIITDRSYYDDFFSKPQNAEILIISDALYDSSIQRHNIQNIFVMMDQIDEGGTGELNVTRLYKYTSVKEIFNEIVGNSAGFFTEEERKKETEIVTVTAASGSVGKTTIAMSIAACLARNYKRVLYINASNMQNFQMLLDDPSVITAHDVYAKLINPDMRGFATVKPVIRNEEFNYLPAFKASMISLGLNKSVYTSIAQSVKESREYDYIIVDAENTLDECKTDLLNISDTVIVVIDQSLNVVRATNMFLSNLNGGNSDKYLFVCNRFDKNSFNALHQTDTTPAFTVNEYIKDISTKDYVTYKDMAETDEIRRIAFLLM